MTPIHEIVADYGPVLGLIGVSGTLLVNGSREERRRRRDNHARAIQAVVAYAEMPYRIRRRRHEAEHRSAERARLSDAFSEIQAELASCEARVRADRDLEVRDTYQALTKTLRLAAGQAASEAWKTDPVEADTGMAMPDVYEALAPVRAEQERCETVMAASTRPFWRSTST